MSIKLVKIFGLDMKYFYDGYYEPLGVNPDLLKPYRAKVNLI